MLQMQRKIALAKSQEAVVPNPSLVLPAVTQAFVELHHSWPELFALLLPFELCFVKRGESNRCDNQSESCLIDPFSLISMPKICSAIT
jgi:hypothetical protein